MNMTVEVALVLSAVSVCFSVYMGLKNSKHTDTKDIEERVRNNTTINIKLDEISKAVQEIRNENVGLNAIIKDHNDRIIKCEESTKSAHHRLDMIEQREGVANENKKIL